ncbi:capsid cement protein [Agromyces sp. NPDC058104]|uniref:capsid cement protein n=1 Tax=Agromyces sp. NPDC058104 TaxID=3346342 RepID=UPI0036DA30D5
MGTRAATIKTNNLDPIFNIPVSVPQAALVREFLTVGDLVGVVKSEPVPDDEGAGYHATLGILAEVGVDGIAGTCAVGAKVYITSANVITLTAGTNRQVGIATRAKTAAGSRLWFLVTPSLGLAAAA